MNNQSLVFSGRAEMTKDVFAIIHAISASTRAMNDGTGLVKTTIELAFLEPGFFCDEACVELHFNRPMPLEWMRERVRAAGETPYGKQHGVEPHVFLQTLRPVPMIGNNMERDYNLS